MLNVLRAIGWGIVAIIVWTIPVIVILKPSIGSAIGIDPIGSMQQWVDDISRIKPLGLFGYIFCNYKGSFPIASLLIAIGCVLLVINNAFHIESVALKKYRIILLLIPGVPLAIILLYCIIAVAFSCAYLILFPILFLIGVVFYLAMALVPIVIVISVIKRKQTDE